MKNKYSFTKKCYSMRDVIGGYDFNHVSSDYINK